MDLEKNKQRLEILAAEVEELKNGGGGEDLSDYLTKAEASSTYETQSAASSALELKADKATTYTKTEVDSAIASASGDVIVDGDNVKTKNAGLGKGILIGNQAGFNSTAAYAFQIAIGTRAGIANPNSNNCPIAIGYQASGIGSDIVIGTYSTNRGSSTNNTLVGQRIDARGSQGVGIGYQSKVADYGVSIGCSSGANYTQMGTYVGFGCQTKTDTPSSNGQTAIGSSVKVGGSYCVGVGKSLEVNAKQVVLGRYNVESNDEDYFAVGNGMNNNTRSNLFSFSNNLFYCGNDTTGYDLRYFAPADETLTNGGTISATALANANKHVPLSFNAHMCYYSYEDNDNVYYTSTRLNGTTLHTNVIAINKTTGVATFNEFDQS